jgi:hypothetical protein
VLAICRALFYFSFFSVFSLAGQRLKEDGKSGLSFWRLQLIRWFANDSMDWGE